MLGWQDIRQAYRRSRLGQFWITIGMATQVLTIGIVFGLIFKTPIDEYLPFLTISTVLFSLFSQILTEGVNSLPASEQMIKQLNLPAHVYVARSVWKSLLIFLHNLVIVPAVFLLMGKQVTAVIFLALPGLLLAILNLTWMAIILAIAAARFRDIIPIVGSAVTILYYVTPVMWQPTSLPTGTAHLLLGLNPFYHLLQVTRLPFLSQQPTIENWIVSTVMLIIGAAGMALIYKKYERKISLWI